MGLTLRATHCCPGGTASGEINGTKLVRPRYHWLFPLSLLPIIYFEWFQHVLRLWEDFTSFGDAVKHYPGLVVAQQHAGGWLLVSTGTKTQPDGRGTVLPLLINTHMLNAQIVGAPTVVMSNSWHRLPIKLVWISQDHEG